MRCIYRGWQLDVYRTHVELYLTAFAPHFPRKQKQKQNKGEKISHVVFSLLFPTFIYLFIF